MDVCKEQHGKRLQRAELSNLPLHSAKTFTYKVLYEEVISTD